MFLYKVLIPQPEDLWGVRIHYHYDSFNTSVIYPYAKILAIMGYIERLLDSYNPILSKEELLLGRAISAIFVAKFFGQDTKVNDLLVELEI